jgi:hypothetical protein
MDTVILDSFMDTYNGARVSYDKYTDAQRLPLTAQ